MMKARNSVLISVWESAAAIGLITSAVEGGPVKRVGGPSCPVVSGLQAEGTVHHTGGLSIPVEAIQVRGQVRLPAQVILLVAS